MGKTKFSIVLAIALLGFAGGCVSPWFVGWFLKNKVPGDADAIAIANTYIIFTTLIFVGFTVVLGVAGYVFTQHFSESQEMHTHQVCEELKLRIKEDEKVGISLANAMLENRDVIRHLKEQLKSKVDELVKDAMTSAESNVNNAALQAEAVRKLADKLGGGSHD